MNLVFLIIHFLSLMLYTLVVLLRGNTKSSRGWRESVCDMGFVGLRLLCYNVK